MIKFLIITLFLLTTLQSRENPFFPTEGEVDIQYVNRHDAPPPLKRATITLPAHARVIQSVTINYKNLDGSQESKTLELDNSIDWHLPVFISQRYGESASEAPKKESKKSELKKIAEFKYASFMSAGKTLKILTKDKMIRDFLLVKPHRIVLDFEKDVSMKNYTKTLPNNVFTKIRVGNHSGYYRIVLELDGYYRYNVKKTSDGYLFNLK